MKQKTNVGENFFVYRRKIITLEHSCHQITASLTPSHLTHLTPSHTSHPPTPPTLPHSHTPTLTHGPERWEAGLEEGEEGGKEGVQLDQFAVEEVLVCEGGHWEGRGHPLRHT